MQASNAWQMTTSNILLYSVVGLETACVARTNAAIHVTCKRALVRFESYIRKASRSKGRLRSCLTLADESFGVFSSLILADESCGVFSRVWTVAWCSSCCKLFHVVSVIASANKRADINYRRR